MGDGLLLRIDMRETLALAVLFLVWVVLTAIAVGITRRLNERDRSPLK